MEGAAAAFFFLIISRLIGRFSMYSWRAATGVVFTALQINLRAFYWAVSRWFRSALLVVSITSL